MRISDWSSDVCSSDLLVRPAVAQQRLGEVLLQHRRDDGMGLVVADEGDALGGDAVGAVLGEAPVSQAHWLVHLTSSSGSSSPTPYCWLQRPEFGRASFCESVCLYVSVLVCSVTFKK